MVSIKFQHNWNGKLDNNFFTTIRTYTNEKLAYYQDLIGYKFRVILKGRNYCEAELQKVEEFLKSLPQ